MGITPSPLFSNSILGRIRNSPIGNVNFELGKVTVLFTPETVPSLAPPVSSPTITALFSYFNFEEMMDDAEKRMTMAKAARALARPDAAQQVADVVLSLIASEQTT